jgi:hypothetical protein
MRILGSALIVLGGLSALIGCFFGRASWVGVNSRSAPTWVLWESLAAFLLILGLVVRISRASH